MASSSSQGLTVAMDPELRIAPGLSRLPAEVMVQIFLLLDNPASFSQTSRDFLKISRDVYFRARWFRNRFPYYLVLFEAIGRPAILNSSLLEMLLKFAPISRHLVQLLHLLHNPAELGRHRLCRRTNWGTSLRLRVYIDILSKAYDAWGDTLSFLPEDLDDLAMGYTYGMEWERRNTPLPRVQELMAIGNYMPLPIGFVSSELGNEDEWLVFTSRELLQPVENLLAWHPETAPLVLRAGYEPNFENSIVISRLVVDGDSPDTCADRVAKLVTLQDYGILQISRTIICHIFLKTLHYTPVDDEPEDAHFNAWYDAVLGINSVGHLAFDLEDLLRSVVTQLAMRGAVDGPVLRLVEKLYNDWPDIDASDLYVPGQFFKAESAGIDEVEVVKGMMGRHVVTRAHVMKACIRNGCASTLPIRFAARFVLGFEAECFLAELMEVLLRQPYRGIMIRELDRLAKDSSSPTLAKCDFRRMLATAIERKGFTVQQLPELQHTQANESQDVRRTWSHRAIFLLTFDWRHYHSLAYGSDRHEQLDASPGLELVIRLNEESPGIDPSPTGALGFIEFVTREDVGIETEIGSAASSSSVEVSSAYLSDPESDGLGVVQVDRLWDVARRPDAGCPRDMLASNAANLKGRCQNILGPIDNEAEAIAIAIVSILGHTSKAANVLLSHAFLNDNDKLICDLLTSHSVPLTLEHLKVAMQSHGMYRVRQGGRMTVRKSMRCILQVLGRGVPFLVSHGAKENECDPSLIQIGAKLSAEEKEECGLLATSDVWPRSFKVHDQAGRVRLELMESPDTHPIARIVTGPISAGTSADSTVKSADSAPEQQVEGAGTMNNSFKLTVDKEARFFCLRREPKRFLDGLPQITYDILDRSVHSQRLKSANLWHQHLQVLTDAEQRSLTALNIAFEVTHPDEFHQLGEMGTICETIQLVRDELHAATTFSSFHLTQMQMAAEMINNGFQIEELLEQPMFQGWSHSSSPDHLDTPAMLVLSHGWYLKAPSSSTQSQSKVISQDAALAQAQSTSERHGSEMDTL